MLAVVPGTRGTESVEEVVTEVKDRLDEQPPALMTSDEYPVYETVIEEVFSQPVVAPKEPARPGRRPLLPERRLDPGVTYATVRKERAKDRVVAVHRTVVLGSQQAVDRGVEGVGVQPDDQHVVRGASARDGAVPERAAVAADVSVQ